MELKQEITVNLKSGFLEEKRYMCHRWCSRCLHVFSAMPSDVSKCIDRAISTSSMWFLKADTNRLLSSNNDYHNDSGCQSGNRSNANWVRLGDSNIEKMDDDTGAINVRVIERMRHPLYKLPSRYHDIARLNGEAIAMGWGTVEWGGNSSSDLLKVTLNLIPHSECNRIFTNGENDSTLHRKLTNLCQWTWKRHLSGWRPVVDH
ncbi:uncharacterized protein LOC122534158 [Frieseomelitta varia]|uniref:uncharacterized protein LOC122534158 n=1 Tax=Frieseomelitta varia TaxID=561572 RepID=UPI001CB68994|nr:uncharacterized protein LOC122534158 [Frieseomelitta varia]